MYQRAIKLPNINDVYAFHKRINEVSCDVDLVSENFHYTVDAKSLMGILSMDLTSTVIIRAITNEEKIMHQIDEIIKDMHIEGDME